MDETNRWPSTIYSVNNARWSKALIVTEDWCRTCGQGRIVRLYVHCNDGGDFLRALICLKCAKANSTVRPPDNDD